MVIFALIFIVCTCFTLSNFYFYCYCLWSSVIINPAVVVRPLLLLLLNGGTQKWCSDTTGNSDVPSMPAVGTELFFWLSLNWEQISFERYTMLEKLAHDYNCSAKTCLCTWANGSGRGTNKSMVVWKSCYCVAHWDLFHNWSFTCWSQKYSAAQIGHECTYSIICNVLGRRR